MTRGELIALTEREYALRRKQNEIERSERVKRAREADPEMAKLLDAQAALFQLSARQLLHDKAHASSIAEQMRQNAARLGAQIHARLREDGLAPDELELRYRCADCKDTGYRGEDRTVYCACFEKRLLATRYEYVEGLPEHSFERFDRGVFPNDKQRAQAEAAKDLCERYANGYPDARLNLLLMGESGLGKTFLLDSIARRVSERGYVVLRLTAFRMLEAMRAYHFGENGEDARLTQMVDCPLLLLDDLGSEPMLRNITTEYLFMLLNERLSGGRHTVIATNQTPGQLKERYGERVLSRMMDATKGYCIRLAGEDLRYRRT